MTLLHPALSGLLAGLALAAPLGAIGVLLVQEGVARGVRRGTPGAVAVALVDVMYCSAAVLAGSVAGPIITSGGRWPQVVGGAVLVVLGLRGLFAARWSREDPPQEPTSPGESSRRRFALFVGLTALNPATLLFFLAILPGLDQVASTATERAVFVVGVGVASLGWQAMLVALGAALRRVTTPGFRRWTGAVGNGLITCLGIALVARAL